MALIPWRHNLDNLGGIMPPCGVIMTTVASPTYDLLEVQLLARRGFVRNDWQVLVDLVKAGLSEEDVTDCILALTPSDFCHSVPSTVKPSEMLDVYKPTYRGKPKYLKLKLTTHGDSVFVLSFKRDEKK